MMSAAFLARAAKLVVAAVMTGALCGQLAVGTSGATDSSTAKKGRTWGEAKVVSIRESMRGMRYVFANERCRFTGLLHEKHAERLPRIAKGATVKFIQGPKTLHFVDQSGKEYELVFLMQELMPPPPPSPTPAKP